MVPVSFGAGKSRFPTRPRRRRQVILELKAVSDLQLGTACCLTKAKPIGRVKIGDGLQFEDDLVFDDEGRSEIRRLPARTIRGPSNY